MTRPIKPRFIRYNPRAKYFKPRGIPLRLLDEIVLAKDEMEAFRLCDFKNLEQTEAANKMKISQSTLQRILTLARQKTAHALAQGLAIKIQD